MPETPITVATQKLYFKKFVYCIKLSFQETGSSAKKFRGNPHIRSVKTLLEDSGVPHRTRLDWHILSKKTISITFSVYLSDPVVFQLLMTGAHAQHIAWVSQPASDLHRDLLLSNTEILIRPRLLYGRFKYKVHLRTGFKRQDQKPIMDWLEQSFGHRPRGKQGDWMVTGSWLFSVYLRDDADLMLLRMVWGDNMMSVTRIDLLSEHGLDDFRALSGHTP